MSILRFLNPFHMFRVLNNYKAISQEFGKVTDNVTCNSLRLEEINTALREINSRLDNLTTEYECQKKEYALQREKYELQREEYELQTIKISVLEKKIRYLTTEQSNVKSDSEIKAGHQKKPQETYGKIDYFDFENHFRGSVDRIRATQEMYLKYFYGHENVIDLGCGRGEFLELLNENKIDAQGVDFYEEFVEMCRRKGLRVTCTDAIEFLRKQQKVGGIFAAQLIEHLTIDQVVTLCELAFEKLEEGAYVIFETPNPTSLAIFTNSFYIDPSHNKPVHPATAQYILQKAGFKEIEIIYTETSKMPMSIPTIEMDNLNEFNHVMKQIENILFGSQDYAIVARR